MIEATRSTRHAAAAGPLVRAVGLTRDYPIGETFVHALRGIDLDVGRGELVAVRGRSGSGKTTLLNLELRDGRFADGRFA